MALSKSFYPSALYRISPNPAEVVKLCTHWPSTERFHREWLVHNEFDVLEFTYERMTAGEPEVSELPDELSREINDWLGIPHHRMYTELRRVTPYPFEDIYENWDDIVVAMQSSDIFDEFLHWIECR
jgi:hypothetical protein